MNDIIEHNGGDIAALGSETSVIQALTRAEIDQQIATAHKFPRSLSKVARNITTLVTMSAEGAAECNYALPRGGQTIQGPSIRLAEIVFSQWGNCRVASRVTVVDRQEKFIEAESIFHDLETNAAVLKRSRRKISDRNGRLYNDDMIVMTGNAAQSIAMRNAIFAGVPKAIWNAGYKEALALIKGDIKTLAERIRGAAEAVQAFGIDKPMMHAILGVSGDRDITVDHLVTLSGVLNGLKNGDITREELLHGIEEPQQQRRTGSITGQTQAKPKEEPKRGDEKSEQMMREEEARAAAQRQREEEEKAQAEAELETLREEFHAVVGMKPDGRWNAETLREKLANLGGGTGRDQDEDSDRIETVENESPEEPIEEDGGEEPEPEPEQDTAPDGVDYARIYDDIVNDLMDATDPQQVIDMYSDTIADMAKDAPDLHAKLTAEIAEAM